MIAASFILTVYFSIFYKIAFASERNKFILHCIALHCNDNCPCLKKQMWLGNHLLDGRVYFTLVITGVLFCFFFLPSHPRSQIRIWEKTFLESATFFIIFANTFKRKMRFVALLIETIKYSDIQMRLEIF